MSDLRMSVDGSTTVRVYGLDAKATSIGTVQFELESLLSDGLRLGNSALEAGGASTPRPSSRTPTGWCASSPAGDEGRDRQADRGPLARSSRRDPFGDEAASSERLAVTVEPGTSAAVPRSSTSSGPGVTRWRCVCNGSRAA